MQLQDIYIYPIKSLGGFRVDQANLEEKGFQYDRRWMLVDKEGRFLTQREHNQMALFQVELNEQGLFVVRKNNPEEKVTIPMKATTEVVMPVRIWDDEVSGQLVDIKVSEWFSKQLQIECDLVLFPEFAVRKLKPKYAVNNESVSYADGMPYLLIGQGSLDDLNQKLDEAVGMERFRPNLVISGAEPFEEDTWEKIRIGDAEFKISKPCARCVMTTIDQETAEKGKEPLKTLASYRLQDKKIMFGQNLIQLNGAKVQVGDNVEIIKKKPGK